MALNLETKLAMSATRRNPYLLNPSFTSSIQLAFIGVSTSYPHWCSSESTEGSIQTLRVACSFMGNHSFSRRCVLRQVTLWSTISSTLGSRIATDPILGARCNSAAFVWAGCAIEPQPKPQTPRFFPLIFDCSESVFAVMDTVLHVSVSSPYSTIAAHRHSSAKRSNSFSHFSHYRSLILNCWVWHRSYRLCSNLSLVESFGRFTAYWFRAWWTWLSWNLFCFCFSENF